MGRCIHACRVDGELRYRVWSTVVDSYLTPEMSASQVLRWMLHEAIRSCIEQFQRDFSRQIFRARHDVRDGWAAENMPSDAKEPAWSRVVREIRHHVHIHRCATVRVDVDISEEGDTP